MSSIANMLVQLKNAQAAGLSNVTVPFSRMKFEIAKVLEKRGFIEEVEEKKKKMRKAEVPCLSLKLKYEDGVGAINGIKLVSKQSRRVYVQKADLKPVRSGYGILVVSTSKGLMTGDEARKAGLGGEALFEIW